MSSIEYQVSFLQSGRMGWMQMVKGARDAHRKRAGFEMLSVWFDWSSRGRHGRYQVAPASIKSWLPSTKASPNYSANLDILTFAPQAHLGNYESAHGAVDLGVLARESGAGSQYCRGGSARPQLTCCGDA